MLNLIKNNHNHDMENLLMETKTLFFLEKKYLLLNNE